MLFIFINRPIFLNFLKVGLAMVDENFASKYEFERHAHTPYK